MRRIISILFALVLVLSFSLVTVLPAMAADESSTLNVVPFETQALGDGATAEWTNADNHTGSYSVELTTPESPTADDYAAVVVPAPEGLKVGDIESWSFYRKSADTTLVAPYIAFDIDTDDDGVVDESITQTITKYDIPELPANEWYELNNTNTFNQWHIGSTGGPWDSIVIGYEDAIVINIRVAIGGIDPSATDINWAQTCYVDDVAINGVTCDLEKIPENTPFTLQPGETFNFYITNDFVINLAPDTYTITTSVVPVTEE